MAKKKKQTRAEEEKMVEKDVVPEGAEEPKEVKDNDTVPPSEQEKADDTRDGKSVADLEEENRNCHDKLLRMAAEVENYKKRMNRERESFLKYAEENILKELLPTIDNLERALGQDAASEDAATLMEGVELTLKGLLTAVGKFGLTPIASVGQPFDPNFHEALAMEASDEVPAQSIIREFEKGYQFKDRLLRAAKVVVSKGNETK